MSKTTSLEAPRSWTTMAIMGTGLVFSIIALWFLVTTQQSQPTEHTFTLMTYNLRHGEGMDGTIDLKRQADAMLLHNPDLIALQEMDVHTRRSGDVDQPKTLGTLTARYATFASHMDYQGGQYGLAILSRQPPSRVLPVTLRAGSLEPRVALLVEASLRRIPVIFGSVHLDWLADDSKRMEQTQDLIAAFESHRGTLCILAGDLNDTPDSRVLKAFMDAGFIACLPEVPPPFSFGNPVPTKTIDYVLVRGTSSHEILALKSKVPEEPMASDHRPVVSTLTLRVPADLR
ncbi:MAG TPA: endonuclease/exonuclease/phosphatase family protein [Planctomycetota bacterium]|jgi:endonuclease/exonuclease/phosphatase family metal-dependent hydrolase|nr:endonuclease/exonuclease/phosphatase family protein [Planctomycetota bacterium]